MHVKSTQDFLSNFNNEDNNKYESFINQAIAKIRLPLIKAKPFFFDDIDQSKIINFDQLYDFFINKHNQQLLANSRISK